MALLQIAEPDQDNIPHQRQPAIGIDLGTTNSLVATISADKAMIITDNNGHKLIPSVVHYTQHQTDVGNEAVQWRLKDPVNTISSVKRFMAKALTDIEQPAHYPYNFVTNGSNILEILTPQGRKNPVQISGDILRHLKQLAIQNLGAEPVGAVITVPAYFDDSQRQSTKQAAEIAGLKVLRLLNEPTAAAIAYGLDTKNEGTFLVYDLGGGTLDVSILRLNKGIFEVLAVSGDTHLGGDDFDQLIYTHIITYLKLELLNHYEQAKILSIAKQAKEQLSVQETISIHLTLKHIDYSMTLSRDKFFELSNELLHKALLPLKKVLRDAHVTIAAIDEIVLVGGSTRMLNVREALTKYFNKPVLTNLDPDLVVAMGAAIQADALVGNRKDEDWLLLDVIPLSLGIETMGGLVEKIIPRNSTIPISKAQDFTTYMDGQTAMTIHILQGEREKVADCRSLAKFSLKGIPAMNAGAARIRIMFQIDADGLLSVSATEQTTGVNSSIEVKPSFGLSGEQITTMLKESIDHAVDDVHQRQLAEAIIDADSLILAIESAVEQDAALLTTKEAVTIKHQLQQLKDLIRQDLPIQEKTIQLKALTSTINRVTQAFANRRMDKALKRGLTGKDIDTV